MNPKLEHLVNLIFNKLKNYKKKKNIYRKRKFEKIYYFSSQRKLKEYSM